MRELRSLLPLLKRYRFRILLGSLMVVFANAFSLATPYLIKDAIDALGGPARVGRSSFARWC